MNISASALIPAVCISAGFFSLSPLRADETSVWLAESARVSSAGILLPDDAGVFDMEITDAAGVTIEDKPPGGADAKSLVFSGEQVSAFRSVTPFPPPTGAFKVEIEAMIPAGADGEDATLLRHFNQWEIRFTANNPSIAFIMWHDSNVYTQVRVPIQLDEWNSIVAEYTGEELILTAGGGTEKLAAKDLINPNAGSVHLVMGASSTKISDEIMPRLLNGSLANIRITLE